VWRRRRFGVTEPVPPGESVQRGGSWATDAALARTTFRNWDYPQRRQIFSGVRLARDL
jgi:gamma-glutamyl hercynylcysteine S-oxide synthase